MSGCCFERISHILRHRSSLNNHITTTQTRSYLHCTRNIRPSSPITPWLRSPQHLLRPSLRRRWTTMRKASICLSHPSQAWDSLEHSTSRCLPTRAYAMFYAPSMRASLRMWTRTWSSPPHPTNYYAHPMRLQSALFSQIILPHSYHSASAQDYVVVRADSAPNCERPVVA